MEQDPQFGTPGLQASPRDRPAAFGILRRAQEIALVRITLEDGTPPFFDLPGGAIDGDETPQQAVVREFGEETGLAVGAGAWIAKARQYFQTSKGEPVNNLCAFFVIEEASGSAQKVEDDHELIWMAPEAALVRLRHDAHAWAVSAWLRNAGER